ncbi:MAG: MFS transporter [Hyphomonadaceae bacterium]
MTEAAILSEPVKARGGGVAIFLCLLVAMLEGFDIQAIGLVGAKLAEVAGLTKGELGFVFAMTNVGLVVGAAAGGWLADRFGRKPTLIASCLLFGAFTLATTLAADYNTLLIVRVLTGLGLGSALPSMMAISAEVSTPGSRASVATMIFAGTPFGGALSAIFVANLPEHADWRLVFVVGGAAPVLIAALILVLMRETRTMRAAAAGRDAQGGRVLHALFGENRTAATMLI